MDRCVKHPFEAATAACRECGHLFCGECLVYSYGAKKPPYCVQCALAAAGIRRGAAMTPVRAQKSRRLFGRKAQVVEAPAAPTFDEIPIVFPEGLVPGNEAPQSEIAPEVTRRYQPKPAAYDPLEFEPEPALVGAERQEATEWSGDGIQHADFEALSGYDSDAASSGFGSDADIVGGPDGGDDFGRFDSSGGGNDWTSGNDWSGAAPWPQRDEGRGSFF